MSTLHNLQEAQKMGADKTLRDRLVIGLKTLNNRIFIEEWLLPPRERSGLRRDTPEIVHPRYQ